MSHVVAPTNIQRHAYPLVEAARLLGISKSSIYRHADAGKIKLVHIGSRTLVPAAEIARLSTDGTTF
jgi:excisionase family DNA binding protein